jgi:hypothetical protein
VGNRRAAVDKPDGEAHDCRATLYGEGPDVSWGTAAAAVGLLEQGDSVASAQALLEECGIEAFRTAAELELRDDQGAG